MMDATLSPPWTTALRRCAGLLLSVLISPALHAQNPVPVLSSMYPKVQRAGSPAFRLLVYGEGFTPDSQIRWNDSNRTTTYVDDFSLTAEIGAADIASAGTAKVTVFNPAPGGGESQALSFTITSGNPIPELGSILPTIARAGSEGLILEVNGDGFVRESEVRWNGSPRNTTFVDFLTLRVEILQADLSTPGTAAVTVFNPAPEGGTSDPATFTITEGNPVPSLGSINPTTLRAGSAGIMLDVNGEGFVKESEVRWNGTARETQYINPLNLLAVISSADLASAGKATVTVFNPSPGGGTSEPLEFTITAGNPVPRLSSLQPNILRAGSAGFTLEVNGEGFVPLSVVSWNGQPRPTTYQSSLTLYAAIPAGDVAAAGTASVTVFNPAPNGGTSSPLTFTISAGNPLPQLSGLFPSGIRSGGSSFQLSVYGSGFVAGSQVLWNGSARRTTFSSVFEISAEITAIDVVSPGQVSVTVSNPAPGGGLSNTLVFNVTANNLRPEISDLNPEAAVAGSDAVDLTVTGSNYVSSSVVRWNGADRPTTFLNNTQVRARITAADLTAAGTARVTVVNPPPGGGSSNGADFLITSAFSPVPVVDSISPVSARAGSLGFKLTVAGSNFVNKSVVRWNGVDRPTSFESSSLLTALVPAVDIESAGSAPVTVFNPAPGGGESAPAAFNICRDICLGIVSPSVVPLGAPEQKLSLFGFDFTGLSSQQGATSAAGDQIHKADPALPSMVLWNGQPLLTTFINQGQLTAIIPSALLSTAGIAMVTVTGGSSGSSNSIPVPVSLSRPVPIVNALNPPGAQPGSNGLELLVHGTSFASDAKVLWNGTERATTLIDSTQLRATILPADIASPGIATVSVRNPAPGGGTSNEQNFVFANSLNFPRLVTGTNPATGVTEYTGIALVNLSAREATVTFTAYNKAGELLTGPDVTNPIALGLGPRQQLPVVDYQVFGTGLAALAPVGWFRLGSSENRLAGFFLGFDDGLSILDGVNVSAGTLQTAVITEIDELGSNQIHVVNPDSKSVSVVFELYRADGTQHAAPVTRTLNPNAAVAESLNEIFPGTTVEASDYLRIGAGRGITAFAFMGVRGEYVIGLNGQDASSDATTLYSPQYVVGGNQWRSALSIVNLEPRPGNISLRLINDDGIQIGPTRSLPISPRGKLHVTDQAFFVNAGTGLTQGYLEIRSDGPKLAGNVVFGDPARRSFASALPLVTASGDPVVFSQLASNETYFTGLAILNPGAVSARVSIEVFDEDGNTIASKIEEIAPGTRRSRLLTQYFPALAGQNRSLGYFRVTSDQPIASFALFGTKNLTVLSAVPPQVIP